MLLLASVMLSACASLTKEECLSSDWFAIGQRDGSLGLPIDWQFKRHVNACKRVKVVPDQSLWWKGYQSGLVHYCQPLVGLQKGLKGLRYHNVCPAETEPGFLRGHVLGTKHNSAQFSISSNDTKIDSLNRDISALIDEIAGAKPGDVAALRSKIQDKRYEIERLADSNKRNYRDLSRLDSLVAQFKQNPQLDYDLSGL